MALVELFLGAEELCSNGQGVLWHELHCKDPVSGLQLMADDVSTEMLQPMMK